MIFFSNQMLWENIEQYCTILDDIVVLPFNSETKFSVSAEIPLSKIKYEEKKQEIVNHILQQFDKVNDVETLSIALFIFRAVLKRKMFDDNFKDWTPKFKICNYLFFLSLQYLKNSKRTIYVACNEWQVIKNIFSCGYSFFENQSLFNEQYYIENRDSTDEFFELIEQISNRHGDLHSYQITNRDLQNYLNKKNITIDKIRNNALCRYKGQYLSKLELFSNGSWNRIQSQDNLSNPEDDIIIIPIHTFDKCDKQLQNFIATFEAEKCQIPSDPESELIFSYKTDKYFYISKKILNDTQTVIEDFITWGQYENITKYFWGLSVDQKALSDYNCLMTYKIADLLLANGYIIPMEITDELFIPRIEISNYVVDKKLKNKLGDIDIIFYSEYSRTLYLVEYKNYQMMVSREGDLNSEISKVNRENTPEKVNNRRKYICDNFEYCINTLFKTAYDICNVKSIILTTKPCYYFLVHKSENYDYMEWVKFENKALRKEL
jgi:hypothetical protein